MNELAKALHGTTTLITPLHGYMCIVIVPLGKTCIGELLLLKIYDVM